MGKKHNKKAQILSAAKKCFARKGYHQSSMDEICREAGVSKGGCYWHFKSKRDIFLALLEELMQQERTGWQELASWQGSEEEIFLKSGIFFFKQHMKDPDIIPMLRELENELFKDEKIREKFFESLQETKEQIKKFLLNAEKQGKIKKYDLDALALVMIIFFRSLRFYCYLFGGEKEFSRLWKTFCQAILRGTLSVP